MKTITTILLEKRDDLLEKQQQIQQQEQETEKDRLKRAAREFRALLERFAPHWDEQMAKVFRELLKRHIQQHLQPQPEDTVAIAEAPAAVEMPVASGITMPPE